MFWCAHKLTQLAGHTAALWVCLRAKAFVHFIIPNSAMKNAHLPKGLDMTTASPVLNVCIILSSALLAHFIFVFGRILKESTV